MKRVVCVSVLLLFCGAAFAVPVSMNNSLQGFDGHHSQENSPAQPQFLLDAGLDVAWVWNGSTDPIAYETVTFDAVGAHFGTVQASDYGRNYIRTLADGYHTVSFEASVEVSNYAAGQNVFLGVGTGDFGWYQTPDWGGANTAWAEVNGDNVGTLVMGAFNGPAGAELTAVPTDFVLSMAYDAALQQVTYFVDAAGDGIVDYTTGPISAIFAAEDITRIYVGGDDGTTLSNFEITVVPEPATMVILGLGSLIGVRRRR